MTASARPDVHCRLIEEDDLESVIACLRRGFPYRLKAYWIRALQRMAKLPTIEGFPKYGYLLQTPTGVVGVLLMIHSRRKNAGGESILCNLSSWCVDKEFRGYAAFFHATVVKRKDVTYINLSPAAHTRRGIEALGFKRFSDGQILFAPILSARRPGMRVAAFAANAPEAALLSDSERATLAEHAALGCRSLVCVGDGVAYPFVLQRRAVFHRLVPCEQVIYCRGMDEMALCAGPIGRHLLLRAWPIYLIDANGPAKGLVGKYFAGNGPKYFKGPLTPSVGDLSYTELVILGP